jgi:hypothetical protein
VRTRPQQASETEDVPKDNEGEMEMVRMGKHADFLRHYLIKMRYEISDCLAHNALFDGHTNFRGR